MKRIEIGSATRALGIFLLAPSVKAQSWQDMQNDEEAIEQCHEQLHHDMQELCNDLRNDNYGAAALGAWPARAGPAPTPRLHAGNPVGRLIRDRAQRPG